MPKLRLVATVLLAGLMFMWSGLPLLATTGTVAPYTALQFFDNNGKPAAGYKLFTYTSGTTTKVSTYTDVTLLSANTNPIILDSSGRCTIFLTPGNSYKFTMAPPNDADPPTAPIWTRDNISAIPQGSLTATDTAILGTAGESLTAGNAVYLSDGSGGKTAGRWYKADSTNTYSSSAAGQIGMVPTSITAAASGNVMIGGRMTALSGLTAGTIYYLSTTGALTSTAPTNARSIGVADSTTSLVLAPWVGTLNASATLQGVMTVGTQTIAGAKTFSGAAVFSQPVAFTNGGTPSAFYYPPFFAAGTSGTPNAYVSGRIYSDSTQRANTNGAETDLSTYSLAANSLDVDGRVIRVTAWGTSAANANARRYRMYFGATVIADSTSAVWNAYGWQLRATIMRKSGTTQRATGVWEGAVAAATGLNNTIVTASPAETLSGAVTIKTTGQGVATSDILQEGFTIEIVG